MAKMVFMQRVVVNKAAQDTARLQTGDWFGLVWGEFLLSSLTKSLWGPSRAASIFVKANYFLPARHPPGLVEKIWIRCRLSRGCSHVPMHRMIAFPSHNHYLFDWICLMWVENGSKVWASLASWPDSSHQSTLQRNKILLIVKWMTSTCQGFKDTWCACQKQVRN